MKNKMYLCLIIYVLRLFVIGCGADYSKRSAKNNNTKNQNVISNASASSSVAAMCSNTPNPSLEGKTEETIETDVIDPYGYYKGMKYQKINVKDKTGKILSSFDPVAKTASRDEITQVNTEYCVGDQYHIKQNNYQINGKNLDTGVEFSIDLNQLLRENVRQESKIALLQQIIRLEGEVLHDMSISVNAVEHSLDDYPEYEPGGKFNVVHDRGNFGFYDKSIVTNNTFRTLVHEIGHGVQFYESYQKNLKITSEFDLTSIWETYEIIDKEAMGFEFYDIFNKRQALYEPHHVIHYSHPEQNNREMFAFCYEILVGTKTSPNSLYIQEYWPEMIEAFKKYLAQIRSLPIKERNPNRG